MRYLLSLGIVVGLFVTAAAQSYEGGSLLVSRKDYLRSPVFNETYAPMEAPRFAGKGQRIVGICLTFGGMPLMVVGGLELALSNISDSNSIDPDERTILKAEGIILLIVGAAATTTGIVFWTKSSKNMRRSSMRSPGVQQSLSMDLKGTGPALRFRF